MYCFTTLLAINLPSCPLEMNTVSFTPFFLGKVSTVSTFIRNRDVPIRLS